MLGRAAGYQHASLDRLGLKADHLRGEDIWDGPSQKALRE